jgi:hypothetical protein
MLKPTDKLPAISRSSAIDRIQFCGAMLRIHGFLTDAEGQSLHLRIARWNKLSKRKTGKSQKP